MIKIETINSEIKSLEEKYQLIGHLYEMSKGQNTYRITFERYVLASFLDDILRPIQYPHSKEDKSVITKWPAAAMTLRFEPASLVATNQGVSFEAGIAVDRTDTPPKDEGLFSRSSCGCTSCLQVGG